MTLPAAGASMTQNCGGYQPDTPDSANYARKLVECGLLRVPIDPHAPEHDPAILDRRPGRRNSSLPPERHAIRLLANPRADPSGPHSSDPCGQSMDRELRLFDPDAPPQCGRAVACMATFSTAGPTASTYHAPAHDGVERVGGSTIIGTVLQPRVRECGPLLAAYWLNKFAAPGAASGRSPRWASTPSSSAEPPRSPRDNACRAGPGHR